MKEADRITLERQVRYSLKQLESGVTRYAYLGEGFAYLDVAMALRKLILDRAGASSFQQKSDGIFQLLHRGAKSIRVRGFGTYKQSKFTTITPPLHTVKSDIIFNAVNNGKWMSLSRWLEEPIALGNQTRPLTTGEIIGHIADKQGAHIIRQSTQKNIFAGASIVFTNTSGLSAPEREDWEVPWHDFVVGAAVKLLHSLKMPGRVPLVPDHNLAIPDATTGKSAAMKLRTSAIKGSASQESHQ